MKDWVSECARVSWALAISSSVLPKRFRSGCSSDVRDEVVELSMETARRGGVPVSSLPLSVSSVSVKLVLAVMLACARALEADPMAVVALHRSFIPCGVYVVTQVG